jgi:arylsulfatase A-like enzyme
MKTQRLLALALLAALATAPHVTLAQTSQPNILFIPTHNLGYGEVGVYGGGLTRGAPTPRIDSLARTACVS